MGCTTVILTSPWMVYLYMTLIITLDCSEYINDGIQKYKQYERSTRRSHEKLAFQCECHEPWVRQFGEPVGKTLRNEP